MAVDGASTTSLQPNSGTTKVMKLENTEKRDTLINSERHYQSIWEEEGVFNVDAPPTTQIPYNSISAEDIRAKYPKFMGTMAYPYMNGTLHMGHAFTASKIEFGTGFARMQGKRALFPQGYHCTGMPIKACADKLVREIEIFGRNFERYHHEEEVTNGVNEESADVSKDRAKTDVTKFTATKSKAAAKTVQVKYQFQIMLSLGIPKDEIYRFADPQHWLEFFPPLAKQHLTNFGARIDWRRQMVTTDANPYYDTFVRWQMNRLREMNKIKFGKRYTIYSPKDGQACMDHDRSTGEGIGVQEYTAIKMRVIEWAESAQKKISGIIPSTASMYFVPATLRPETMYGQTCCFVGPKVTYGIFKVSDSEFFFMSHRAARNLAFQGIFPRWGEFPQVTELDGAEVIGTLVHAPLSVHNQGIRILPMDSVKPTKGTGVVTSVPSDSPDDFATLVDLAKKAEYYGIEREWAELEMIAIIETPTYGNLTAPTLVKQLKINSPKDVNQLAEAKDLAYKEGFYRGKMIYGEFSGKTVEQAKPLVRQLLLDSGEAFNYAEPEGMVISRSGDDCVAGHLDQWYMNYGSDETGGDGQWQKQVLDHLKGDLNTFSTEAKNQFEQTLGWLGQWACARSFGLGTKLPWDTNFLVESLSDSTIYMSYYTIAHFLHKDRFGKEMGAAQIKPHQMTDEVWDYIFTRSENVVSDIPLPTLQEMRRSFEYWYPLDVNISGKDLIQNHLTFFLYVHLALFPTRFWPAGVRVNGHLMLNGEKMSKSTGNFLTLDEATRKFGADATRIALADAGDGIEDANFEETVANSSILRLYELRKWCEEMVRDSREVIQLGQSSRIRESSRVKNFDTIQRCGELTFWDRIFDNEMNVLLQETKQQYESTFYKAALKAGFYDMTSARDFYRESTKAAEIGMHTDLVRRYIEIQALTLTPVAPHWAEYIWREVLLKPSSIQNAVFPAIGSTDPALRIAREYVRTVSSNVTSAEGAQQKKLSKGKAAQFDPKKTKALTVFTCRSFPSWQDECIRFVMNAFDEVSLNVDMKALTPQVAKMAEKKKAMPFVQGLKRRIESGENAENVFDRKLAIDEEAVLKEMAATLKQTVMRCVRVEIVRVDDAGTCSGVSLGGVGEGIKEGERFEHLPSVAEGAVPGAPTFHFENV